LVYLPFHRGTNTINPTSIWIEGFIKFKMKIVNDNIIWNDESDKRKGYDLFMPYEVLILYKDGTSKVYADVNKK